MRRLICTPAKSARTARGTDMRCRRTGRVAQSAFRLPDGLYRKVSFAASPTVACDMAFDKHMPTSQEAASAVSGPDEMHAGRFS